MKEQKRFLNYNEQLNLLKIKKLYIENDFLAIRELKKYSYYSLITGYKDIFKIQKNGDYRTDASFSLIVQLYLFDDFLRNLFLHEIIRIEKHIKSVYSYSFCELYGDKQSDYLNVNNYNYSAFQKEVNEFTSIIQDTLNNPSRYNYINYNVKKYGTVPFWVIIQTLTLGNISKMYSFSTQKLKSRVSKEFKEIYSDQLESMLNVLSKFRNVCAHGERLYNYKTKKSIKNLPIHYMVQNYSPQSKNDLFSVLLCIKYLSDKNDFSVLIATLEHFMKKNLTLFGEYYTNEILDKMGFPKNWLDIIKL